MENRNPEDLNEIIRLINRLIGSSPITERDLRIFSNNRFEADQSYEEASRTLIRGWNPLVNEIRSEVRLEQTRTWNLYSEIIEIIRLYSLYRDDPDPLRRRS